MVLNFKLNFQEHFENMLNKVNKTLGLLQNFQTTPIAAPAITGAIRGNLKRNFLKGRLCNTSDSTKNYAVFIKF